jgi:hypothetical protein
MNEDQEIRAKALEISTNLTGMMVPALMRAGKFAEWNVLDKKRLNRYVEYIKNGVILEG